jgi:hypothetical protein
VLLPAELVPLPELPEPLVDPPVFDAGAVTTWVGAVITVVVPPSLVADTRTLIV